MGGLNALMMIFLVSTLESQYSMTGSRKKYAGGARVPQPALIVVQSQNLPNRCRLAPLHRHPRAEMSVRPRIASVSVRTQDAAGTRDPKTVNTAPSMVVTAPAASIM